jgi:calcium permeable stress-gated cation channel
MFGWVKDYRAMPDAQALRHQSLDAYLYIRFFKIVVAICSVGCCITWPVLFPVNITGGGTESQLSQLTLSNISDGNTNRLYAHAACAWLFLGLVLEP